MWNPSGRTLIQLTVLIFFTGLGWWVALSEANAQKKVYDLKTENSKNNSTDQNKVLPLSKLQEWMALRNLSIQELQNKFFISEKQIQKGRVYLRLENLTELHDSKQHPAHFYFQQDRLKMIYCSTDSLFPQWKETDLMKELGGSGNLLRSRAGKRANLHVYPQKGFAFSSEDNIVQFIEIFPPTTLAEYTQEIYRDPGPFTK